MREIAQQNFATVYYMNNPLPMPPVYSGTRISPFLHRQVSHSVKFETILMVLTP